MNTALYVVAIALPVLSLLAVAVWMWVKYPAHGSASDASRLALHDQRMHAALAAGETQAYAVYLSMDDEAYAAWNEARHRNMALADELCAVEDGVSSDEVDALSTRLPVIGDVKCAVHGTTNYTTSSLTPEGLDVIRYCPECLEEN